MPNQWDRYHDNDGFPEGDVLPCPVCDDMTNSLKQYKYVDLIVFFGAGAMWQEAHYRACPGCMRALIVQRAALNFFPANLFWLVLVFPWGLRLMNRSYAPGHSPEAVESSQEDRLPPPVASHSPEKPPGFGSDLLLIFAAMLAWFPCFGVPFGLFGWLVSRGYSDWRWWVGLWCVFSTLIFHAFVLVRVAIRAA